MKTDVHRHPLCNLTEPELLYEVEWAKLSVGRCVKLVETYLKGLAVVIAVKGVSSVERRAECKCTPDSPGFYLYKFLIAMHFFASTSKLWATLCWSVIYSLYKIIWSLFVQHDKMWKASGKRQLWHYNLGLYLESPTAALFWLIFITVLHFTPQCLGLFTS